MTSGATTTRRDSIPMKNIVTTLAVLAAATSAHSMEITEVMYKGMFGEFVEVTNTTGSTILAANLANWSFDDNSLIARTVVFPTNQGNLANGQCVIITEVSRTIFNQAWFVEPSKSPDVGTIIYIDNNTTNLGRSDAAAIFDLNSLTPTVAVDVITFNDEAASGTDPKGPRTEDTSAVQDASDYSTALDQFKFWAASGNPDTGAILVTNSWKAGVPGKTGSIGSPGKDITRP